MSRQKKYTIHELIAWGEAQLAKKQILIDESRDLLSAILGKTPSYLVGHSSDTVPEKSSQEFKEKIKARMKGVPFAYLTRTKGFYGLDFFIDDHVLIPRPETEELIDYVLKNHEKTFDGTIVDVGTGSGCIAITIAKYLPQARVIAIDISSQALTVAKKNAKERGLAKRIVFKQGNLLTPLSDTTAIDLIVSNPPYLEKHELAAVPYEPVTALYGGRHGLEVVDELIEAMLLRQIPEAIIEISPTQEGWLEMHLKEFLEYHISFLKDSRGRTRFLTLKKKT